MSSSSALAPSVTTSSWSKQHQRRHVLFVCLVAIECWWLTLTCIAWCGRSSGRDGKLMTFVSSVSARDELPRGRKISGIAMQVRERRRAPGAGPRGGGGNGGNRGKDVEAKRLTTRMREAKSAEEFVNVLEEAVDGPIFNYYHASASYTRLKMWKSRGELLVGDKTTLVLDKLNGGVKEMASKLNPQACANVLWSIAHLSDAMPNAVGVVPAIAAQIPLKAKDMDPQGLSNILWASANLKDDAPDVLSIVPAIATQIPLKANDMNLQDLSQTLVGLLSLQDSVLEARSLLGVAGGREDDFLKLAILRTQKLIPKARGNDLVLALPAIAWASARLELHSVPQVHQLLGSLAERLGSPKRISSLSAWALCALHKSYKVLDPSEEFGTFEGKLKAEIGRRRLSAADVESSFEGPLEWGGAKRLKVAQLEPGHRNEISFIVDRTNHLGKRPY